MDWWWFDDQEFQPGEPELRLIFGKATIVSETRQEASKGQD